MKYAVLVSLLLAGATASSQPSEGAKPNILFLIADDLATRVGCYGNKAALTPNIDRLAGESVVFQHAYAQGFVCTPSRTSFMLGLNNKHARANHFIEHPETMPMGCWFREHGYQTCAIGKIDHADPNDSYVDPKAWDVRVKREEMAPKARLVSRSLDEDLGAKRKNISIIGISDGPEKEPFANLPAVGQSGPCSGGLLSGTTAPMSSTTTVPTRTTTIMLLPIPIMAE